MLNMCNLDFLKSIDLCSCLWEQAIQQCFKYKFVLRKSDLSVFCTHSEILEKIPVTECDFGAFQLWATEAEA